MSKISKGGGSNIKGGICPLCINHCRIYNYRKICLDWQKNKHTDECTILNKFINNLTFAHLGDLKHKCLRSRI